MSACRSVAPNGVFVQPASPVLELCAGQGRMKASCCSVVQSVRLGSESLLYSIVYLIVLHQIALIWSPLLQSFFEFGSVYQNV